MAVPMHRLTKILKFSEEKYIKEPKTPDIGKAIKVKL